MNHMEVPIQLPAPVRRTGGLFVDVATPISTEHGGRDRIGAGVVHVPWGCSSVNVGPSELCYSDEEPATDGVLIDDEIRTKDVTIRDFPAEVFHPAFKIVDGLKCSSLSFPHDTTPVASIGNRLRSRASLQLSRMLTAELVAGIASSGPNLASESVPLTPMQDMEGAAAEVETWLARILFNGIGAVVLPVGLLAAAVKAKWVNPDTLRTVSGHYVIADAGFTGDPTDPLALYPSSYSIFGMGLPGWASSSAQVLEVASGASHVDITDNIVRMLLEQYVQIAFEPCTVGEVTLGSS